MAAPGAQDLHSTIGNATGICVSREVAEDDSSVLELQSAQYVGLGRYHAFWKGASRPLTTSWYRFPEVSIPQQVVLNAS